jgi:hypothetical protein
MARVFSKVVADSKVMASGIRANSSVLVKHGIDEVCANDLETRAGRILELSREQEILKGNLKQKTAELNALVGELDKCVANTKKIVKIDMPKEAWKEFGITVTQ